MTEQSHLWYENLNSLLRALAVPHNLTIEQVAGIFVSFSAQKEFAVNLDQTIQFLDNKPLTGMYSRKQLDTARRILSGENPLEVWSRESYKYRNFYDSILLKDGAVCVDTHIIRYYLNKYPYSRLHRVEIKRIFEKKWAYRIIQNDIRKDAKILCMKSYQAQAHIWFIQRGAMW